MKPLDTTRPKIPEILQRFATYHSQHPAWGALHTVLDDNNVRDCDVIFCIHHADLLGDTEGRKLAEILLKLPKRQRIRLGSMRL